MTYIDVMKQALEALNTLPCGDSYKTHNAQVQLTKAIEKAEKVEPVGIVNQAFDGVEWLIDWSKTSLPDDTPLYTAPPQREWVGLTDAEIDAKTDFRATVRYFESILKEKNT